MSWEVTKSPRTPKYGNDDDYADQLMRRAFAAYHRTVDGRPNRKGGHYRINMLPTTCHVYFGSVIGATPDGRRAGRPLSEGISPAQGADRKGPTASLNSVAQTRCGEYKERAARLLNMKLTPSSVAGSDGTRKLMSLIRTACDLRMWHLQFNIINSKTLIEAQKNPEKYRNLLVRVAGYSAYFVDLTPQLQNEIIERTEHEGF